MVNRNKIVKFCEDYLEVSKFSDYCVNGLQVEGGDEVAKIVTGVSLSQKLIEEAVKRNAQMIMVHHGIFKSDMGDLPCITGVLKERVKLLLENSINLCGFHLPLDAHLEIGNNISLCNLFGIKNVVPFDVGFIGELKKEVNFDDFLNVVKEKLGEKIYLIQAGKKKVQKVAIISGGASPDFEEAAKLGADVYLTGDVREEVVRKIEEIGINFINAGHYNTEKLGIQNLGELIAKEFDIDVEFVDIPCDI